MGIEHSGRECDCCGRALPYGWIVAKIEAMVPEFTSGQVGYRHYLNNSRPVIEPVVISSADAEVLDGLGVLGEMEDIEEWEGIMPFDCLQELIDLLDGVVPDTIAPDSLLYCDYCHEELSVGEPMLRVTFCLIDFPTRNPTGGASAYKLEEYDGFSEMDMCLNCAKVIDAQRQDWARNENQVRAQRGQHMIVLPVLWPGI